MSFTEKINNDIKQAMLAKDKDRLAALRDIKAKLLLEATSGGGSEVSDEVAMKICLKLHKQRIETYDVYIAQGREDLAADELFQGKECHSNDRSFIPSRHGESYGSSYIKACWKSRWENNFISC